jgi:hypothetical protein
MSIASTIDHAKQDNIYRQGQEGQKGFMRGLFRVEIYFIWLALTNFINRVKIGRNMKSETKRTKKKLQNQQL